MTAPTVGPWEPDHTEHASDGDVRRVYLDGSGDAATAGMCGYLDAEDDGAPRGHCFVWVRHGSKVADDHAIPGGIAAAQRAADAALVARGEVLTTNESR